MAISISKENYVLHKLHSLTGVVPTGYYVVQHLVLNTFSLQGSAGFDKVIMWFEKVPKHLLLALEIFAIWIPLAFHAVYGMMIVGRAQNNYFNTKYKWSQNAMYAFQRYSGIFLFVFLCYHVATTTGAKYLYNDAELIKYAAWNEKLTSNGYAFLLLYMAGVFTAAYHLCYGIWNFCIRWGITISDKAQLSIQRFSTVAFIGITAIGWLALFGFVRGEPAGKTSSEPAVETALR
jgi:succinate dehydrogenase / fumarate reductase, cytochrome b subunit